MPTDLIKTFTYLSIHLTIGFSVAYVMTGSFALAGGIAIIEPCINAVAFFLHEKAWQRAGAGRKLLAARGRPSPGRHFRFALSIERPYPTPGEIA